MSGGFESNDGFYSGEYYHQQQQQPTASYDDSNNTQFNPNMQWASTDYRQQGYDQSAFNSTPYEQQTYDPYASQPGSEVFNNPSSYTGSILTPDMNAPQQVKDGQTYDDEPPLLEELGINFDHITQKTLTVLNPVHQLRPEIMEDTDMAGPFVFILGFGASLLLAGKVQFGYIYGVGVLGCVGVYILLNLMSVHGVSVGCVISVLGYCLLPMDLLSFLGIVLSLQGPLGTVLTLVTVAWCAYSASKLFVSALAMDQQQLLVAYPCALLYGVFALLAVF